VDQGRGRGGGCWRKVKFGDEHAGEDSLVKPCPPASKDKTPFRPPVVRPSCEQRPDR
jgi:hypothetical protein